MTTVFENIYHGLSKEAGEFRMVASGLGWKSANDPQKRHTFQSADMKYIQWLRVARNYQLRIIFNNGDRETFDGFMKEEDHDKIASLVKQHFNIALETKEMSFKGWNWGAFDVQGRDLAFLVSNKTAFEVPLGKIANSNMAGKNEVSLEFALSQPPPSGKRSRDDELTEIRLFIPNTYARDNGEDGEAEKMDVDEDVNAAEAFHDMIKEKAEIGQVTGDAIAQFDDINITTPRGRFTINMYKEFLQLRGKMYDYRITYPSITKLFILPKPDEVHLAFVVGLDPPIRQGQTRHPYIVMQTSQEEELELELSLEEDEIQKEYGDKLTKKYDAPVHEVLSNVFRGLVGKKITAPASDFLSRDEHRSIRTSLKAAQGDLYFLDKGLLFLGKPVTHIEYQYITSAVFSRVGNAMTSARTFDLKIQTANSETIFSNINKEEQNEVERFLESKQLRVKSEINDDMLLAGTRLDDDEDMESGGESESEDDRDTRDRGKNAKAKIKPNGPMDDDSEEDEDFQAESSDEGSPSETDSDSGEGAATASDASGDEDFMKPKKKKKAAAAAAAGGDGEGGDTPKKKKKVKKADKAGGPQEDGNDRPKKKVKTKKAAGGED
ncbi:FACT complex subunit POB-3-like protein [Clavulina sp. PMI_390]|nr:FACT complex subunit POB-3-like protein [Clavulina sp. PMI_390]